MQCTKLIFPPPGCQIESLQLCSQGGVQERDAERDPPPKSRPRIQPTLDEQHLRTDLLHASVAAPSIHALNDEPRKETPILRNWRLTELGGALDCKRVRNSLAPNTLLRNGLGFFPGLQKRAYWIGDGKRGETGRERELSGKGCERSLTRTFYSFLEDTRFHVLHLMPLRPSQAHFLSA